MKTTAKMVEYPFEGVRVPGYLAEPEEPGTYPGIVVLQEWWGLVPHIKDVAERLAAEGFVALAPDLYHGAAAAEPDEARKLAMALDRERAIGECGAAGSYLAGLDRVSPKRVGVIGWCMGGGLSLSASVRHEVFGATVCFYGRPLERDDVARLRAPVLGLFGEEDKGIPVSLVRDFEKQMSEFGVPGEVVIYPGAPHAFFNDTRPEAYHPEAAEDAWHRALEWFRRNLG